MNLESHIERVTESGCWLWMGGTTTAGYGEYHREYAHRLAWKAYNGEISNDLHVLHKCDVPCCVHPDHLFLGTNRDNINDSMLKGRRKGVIGNRHNPGPWPEDKRKIKRETRDEIRTKYAAGNISMRALSMEYGISHTTVQKIVTGKRYGGIPVVP